LSLKSFLSLLSNQSGIKQLNNIVKVVLPNFYLDYSYHIHMEGKLHICKISCHI